jgi:hypothetical protein
MIPPQVIAAGIAAIPSIVKGVQGIFQGAKGSKLAKKNIRPTYEIPKEFQQNLAIAENMGRVGLPQQQYNQAQQNFQRNQAGALRQFGRMGNPRGLAGIVRAGNDASLGLDVADANARMSNQRNAMGYRSQMGQQQLAKQNYDKFMKYGEQADAAAALQGAGRQNVMGGLSELSQVGQMAMYNGGFGGKSPTSGQMATGVSQSPNFGNYGNIGQYGTRLGGMNNNTFGGNYNFPMTQLPFSQKFIPKTPQPFGRNFNQNFIIPKVQ